MTLGPSGGRGALLNQLVEAVAERDVGLRLEVAVAVEGEADRGVTGQGSNFLGARAGGDPERDGGVPKVVDAEPSERGGLDSSPPLPAPEVDHS